jgi:hypothetical protein
MGQPDGLASVALQLAVVGCDPKKKRRRPQFATSKGRRESNPSDARVGDPRSVGWHSFIAGEPCSSTVDEIVAAVGPRPLLADFEA